MEWPFEWLLEWLFWMIFWVTLHWFFRMTVLNENGGTFWITFCGPVLNKTWKIMDNIIISQWNRDLKSTLEEYDTSDYSIVKNSSADLGVNSKIVQIRPTVKAVSTKISKKNFCIFVNILIFLSENKKVHFFYFEYLS